MRQLPSEPGNRFVSFVRACARCILCQFGRNKVLGPSGILYLLPRGSVFFIPGDWYYLVSLRIMFVQRVRQQSFQREFAKIVLNGSSERAHSRRVLKESSQRELSIRVLKERSRGDFLRRVFKESSQREISLRELAKRVMRRVLAGRREFSKRALSASSQREDFKRVLKESSPPPPPNLPISFS